MMLEMRPTAELERRLERAEADGKDDLALRIERELDRREHDPGEPEHGDTPSLEDQGLFLGSYAS